MKNKRDKFGEHLVIILDKMCSMVGKTINDIDWDDTQWFMKHTWSQLDSDMFEKWLLSYVSKTKEARKELFERSLHGDVRYGKPRQRLKQACMFFVFNYGWRTM